MGQSLNRILASAVLAVVVPAASASVLTFEDLAGLAFFTQDYQGFQFGTNNVSTTAWFHTDQVISGYAAHSGTHYVATDFQLYSGGLSDPTQPISSATPFIFDGAWFSGEGGTIAYQLFSGSSLVYTSAPSSALTSASTFVNSGYSNSVTSVVILGHQGFYAMDDFTYSTVTAAVPEPEILTMLAAGLAGLGATIRRKRRNGQAS